MVEGIDLQDTFYDYKKGSLDLLYESGTNKANYTKQEILAVNNILFLERHVNATTFIKKYFSSHVLQSLRQQQQSLYKNMDTQFPQEKKMAIEDILDDFSKEYDIITARKQLNEINDDVEDEDVFLIINFVSDLICKVSPNDTPDSASDPSFIHAAMIAIFKQDVYHKSRFSNYPGKYFSWEPCYKVTRLDETSGADHVCCYGGIKVDSCEDDKDLVKIGLYSKTAVETVYFNHFVPFTCHNDKVYFYLLQNLDE